MQGELEPVAHSNEVSVELMHRQQYFRMILVFGPAGFEGLSDFSILGSLNILSYY